MEGIGVILYRNPYIQVPHTVFSICTNDMIIGAQRYIPANEGVYVCLRHAFVSDSWILVSASRVNITEA